MFKPRPARLAGEALYEAATHQARQPAFYARLQAPDTVEGRFELYTLHVVLLLHRLKGLDTGTAAIAQALFDAYLQALDDALREMGVGDLSVGKKMRKLGEAFYGRAKAYDAALAAAGMAGELDGADRADDLCRASPTLPTQRLKLVDYGKRSRRRAGQAVAAGDDVDGRRQADLAWGSHVGQ